VADAVLDQRVCLVFGFCNNNADTFSLEQAASVLTTFIAVISPAKKIENMSIVNVVNAQ